MKGYDKTRPQLYKSIIRQLLKTNRIRKDDSFVRIQYIRYADDFVIGVVGSHTIAKEILGKVETFVNEELKLEFNADKTGIVDFSKDSFNFLGYKIKPSMSALPYPRLPSFFNKKKEKKGTKPLETINLNGKNITRRKKTRIRIEMETDKVVNKLTNNGFTRKRTDHSKHKEIQFRGRFKGNLINLDHPDILKYYNSVLRGLQNYYAFAANRVSVARVG